MITKYEMYDNNEENLLLLATLIEENLAAGGLICGIDYHVIDCFNMAIEFEKAKALNRIADKIEESIYELTSSIDYIASNM